MENLLERTKIKIEEGIEWLKNEAKSISDIIRGWVDRYKKYRATLEQHQEYIDAVLDAELAYSPEEVDKQLCERLKKTIGNLGGGNLSGFIKSLSFEDRKIYIERVLLPKVAADMGISYNFIGWFQGSRTIGYYSEERRGIALNELFLASDEEYVLNFIINTVVHECKHAMQWEAIFDRNTHGYSAEQIAVWRRNMNDYITPEECDEGYVKQPVEWDASSFAESVYPTK